MAIDFWIDEQYIINIRRELHRHPELGFELPRTIALVKRELDAMGIPHTEKYGKSSVVATINPDHDSFTIGLRADMDALPIEEINEVDYKSQEPGKMHACGHDAHTAMLLGTAKALNAIRDKLSCRIKLLFQPSEEGPYSGAEYMVNDGVMDDIDLVVGMHIENWLNAGTVGICPGMSMASMRPFKLEFFGAAAHGTLPQNGKNALAMAVRAYTGITQMQVMELDPFAQRVCSIGKFQAGATANVLPDYAVMEGTIRTYDMNVERHIVQRMESICKNAAEEVGGTAKVTAEVCYPCLYNDPSLSQQLMQSAEKIVGKDNVVPMRTKMSSEDFAFYLTKKPGLFFRLGTKNEEKGYVGLPHNNNFQLDEAALKIGSSVCVQFVIDVSTGLN
ncbi:MAG: M20 family metallopeptidase [Candidatus Pelethousia sp.]|nr:M20 family metallopeptidase [Candidatus Pelethousia sp.]